MSSVLEPLWDVAEEHLDEAEFLWRAWERSLIAPNYTLDEVAEQVESRLIAHCHGLAQFGPPAVPRLLVPALESIDLDRVCAAATTLLLGPGDVGLREVVDALYDLIEQRPAVIRALGCAEPAAVVPRLRGLLTDLNEAIVAAAAEALLFHGEPLGDAIPVLLASDDPDLRALGLKALPGDPTASRYTRAVQAALNDDDPALVDTAIDVGVFLAPAPAWLGAAARAREPGGARSMLLLALRGDPDARQFLVAALQDPALRPSALVALGYIGAPELADASLEWLDDPVAGPLVGEMLTAMTGVDLDDADLTRRRADNDEALDHAPEDDLPRPDPMRVMQWWLRQRPQFQDGERYLAGRLRTPEGILDALAHGPMRRRPGLLLDLQLHVARPLRLQPLAPTRRQHAELMELHGRDVTGRGRS